MVMRRSNEQLLLYSHLASEISPGKKLKTRFLVLTKTKEPVIEEHVREVEPAPVKRTLAGVERVWRAIESGVFYPAPSVMACSGCGYRAGCRSASAHLAPTSPSRSATFAGTTDLLYEIFVLCNAVPYYSIGISTKTALRSTASRRRLERP